MAFEINNENTGMIFPNEVEEGSGKPVFTGVLNVDGVQKRIALWENFDEEGNFKSFGAKIQDPYQEEAPKSKSYSSKPKAGYGGTRPKPRR